MIPRRRYNVEPAFLLDAGGMICRKGSVDPVAAFEHALAGFLSPEGRIGVKAVSSGRAALALVLDRLRVPKGSTIMVPAYTLGALGPFIQTLGYRWATCDVDDTVPVMTAETVDAAWPADGSVSCVLATHLFGIPADVPGIRRVAERHGAVVIEDCAHSAGSVFAGRPTGTMGHGAIFSFSYLKTVNCFGGGAAAIPGASWSEELPSRKKLAVAGSFAEGIAEDLLFAGPWLRIPTAMLAVNVLAPLAAAIDRTFRRRTDDSFEPESMSPLQALHGLRSLSTLEHRLARRRTAARLILAAAGRDSSLYSDHSETRSNGYFLALRVEDARRFRWDLWKKGIDAGTGTEVADYLDCPVCPERPAARKWFSGAVQLPCHEALSEKSIRIICDLLEKPGYLPE